MSAFNDVVMPNDLSELCRVCLQLPKEEDQLDLTTIYDENDCLTYADCFTICTQIDLGEGDDLPRNLCRSCGLELQMTYDFFRKVEHSKRTLELYKQDIQEESSKVLALESDTVQRIKQDITLSPAKSLQQRVPHNTDSSVCENGFAMSCAEAEEFMTISENVTKCSELIDVVTEYGESIDSRDNDSSHQANADDLFGLNEETGDGCLVLEEHLDITEYQSIESLKDEETLQINSEENMLPFDLIQIENDEKYMFEEPKATIDDVDQTEHDPQSTFTQPPFNKGESLPQNVSGKKDSRRWQENVVAVANKHHLPLEAADGTKTIDNDVGFEVIHSDEDLEIEDKEDKTPIPPKVGTTRKRRIGAYTCEFCLKVYPNYSRMVNHRRCHELNRPKYPCEICGRIYATKQAMECHIKTEHKKTGFFCTVCSKVFAIRRSLEVHMRYHNGEFPYECNLCEKKFAQLCHLNTHKNVKHNNVRFACDYPDCGKFFTSSTSLRNHEYSHSVMPFECEFCQRGYPAKAKLKTHIKRKHAKDLSKERLESMRKFHVMRSKVNLVQVMPVAEEETNDTLHESLFVREESLDGDKLYNKDQHKDETVSITLLLNPREKRPITGNKPPYFCELCGHASPSKSLLASHRHRKHRLKVKAHSCPKCGRTFHSQLKLDSHLQRPFCDPYPTFKCEHCMKSISGYANFKIHLRFHQKIYPYVCHECGKGFMLAIHLKTHIQTKHEHKRYVCDHAECGKLFQSQNSLKAHMYVHMDSLPYRCEYCDKMFANKGGLKYHIRKSHQINHTLSELDRMLVANEIVLKAKAQLVKQHEIIV